MKPIVKKAIVGAVIVVWVGVSAVFVNDAIYGAKMKHMHAKIEAECAEYGLLPYIIDKDLSAYCFGAYGPMPIMEARGRYNR